LIGGRGYVLARLRNRLGLIAHMGVKMAHCGDTAQPFSASPDQSAQGAFLISIWRGWRLAIHWLAVAILGCFVHAGMALAAEEVAGPSSLAVVYPDIGEPYRSVFASIIDGIEERTRGKIASFAIAMGGNPPALSDELKRRDIRAVIALGRGGLKVASNLDRQINVVAGGVLSVPEAEAQGMLVQSLAPDPTLLFARLKSFVPSARRVIVVFDPRQNAWLIRLARDAAKAQGMELLLLEAEDLKTAVRRYQEALGAVNPKRDVLWLPQDTTTVEESTVLPLVLREAWNQNLVVFSSNVAHVKRGALFSLYPDNAEMGRYLASAALGSLQVGAQPVHGIQALRQVLTAVNTRTAEHLGVDLRGSSQRIQLVFPEQ
jgi:putative ABC transport system substrate-binding protein